MRMNKRKGSRGDGWRRQKKRKLNWYYSRGKRDKLKSVMDKNQINDSV